LPVKRRGLLRDLIAMLFIVVVTAFGVRMFLQPYEVEGASMEPLFESGDRIFVNRTAYTHVDLGALRHPLSGDLFPLSAPERGDVLILESDQTSQHEQYIKRVVGLPGETITFGAGLVFVDGEPLVEDYIAGAITTCGPTQFCAVTVPDAHVFVLGDNRANSEDSRAFGPIPFEDIVGKAIFSNWPPRKIGPIEHPDYGEPTTAALLVPGRLTVFRSHGGAPLEAQGGQRVRPYGGRRASGLHSS